MSIFQIRRTELDIANNQKRIDSLNREIDKLVAIRVIVEEEMAGNRAKLNSIAGE